jgi:hypothetical protein
MKARILTGALFVTLLFSSTIAFAFIWDDNRDYEPPEDCLSQTDLEDYRQHVEDCLKEATSLEDARDCTEY